MMLIPSRDMLTNISHPKGSWEDEIPFQLVGYVSSLEGNVDAVDVNYVADDDTSSGSLLSNLVKTKILFLNSVFRFKGYPGISIQGYPTFKCNILKILLLFSMPFFKYHMNQIGSFPQLAGVKMKNTFNPPPRVLYCWYLQHLIFQTSAPSSNLSREFPITNRTIEQYLPFTVPRQPIAGF